MAVLDLAALAKERVGLVKEQDGAARLGGVKDTPQVLFRLADVFADHGAQVDAVQIQPQLAR